MADDPTENRHQGADRPPPVEFHNLTIAVPSGTPVHGRIASGIELAVGSGLIPDVTLHLGGPDGAAEFLAAATAELNRLAPDTAPGPDARLVEARDIVREDLLRLAGDPVAAGARALEEFTTTDLRTMRRLLQRELDLLDALVDDATPAGAGCLQGVRS